MISTAGDTEYWKTHARKNERGLRSANQRINYALFRLRILANLADPDLSSELNTVIEELDRPRRKTK